MKELFLDANAHLPMSKTAIKALCDFNGSKAGHGHAMSPNAPGRAAQAAIEGARDGIANILGCESGQLIFTSTCTQACEWATYLLFNKFNAAFNPAYHDKYGRFIVNYSMAEHPAVRQAVEKFLNKYEYSNFNKLKINKDGVIDFKNDNDGAVVSLFVQNEIGTIQPISDVGEFLFSDFSQAPGKVRFKLSETNVDLSVFAAHKFGGPPNVGILYIKDHEVWKEFGTGSRYFMDRAGTPDAGSIVATAAALEEVDKDFDIINSNMKSFRDELEIGLEELGIEIIGKDSNRVNNTTFINCKNAQGMKIMLELGNEGIYTGLGSACGSAYSGLNPFLSEMGIKGSPHDFMRISTFGEYMSKDASYFLEKFRKYYLKGGDLS